MSVEVAEGGEVALTVMVVEGALDRTVVLSLALVPSGQLAITAIVYLTSPEPLKTWHNLFILHSILKTLTPSESSRLPRFDDILHCT